MSGQPEYPERTDVCIYCQQALSQAARALIDSYRNYASGSVAERVRSASAELTALQSAFLAPLVVTAVEALRATLPALSDAEHVPEWVPDSQALLAHLEVTHGAVQSRQKPEPETVLEVVESLLPRLAVALEEAEAAIRGLEGDTAHAAELLADQRAKVALIEARLRLAQLLSDIRTYVEDAAWADRLRTLLGRFQGLLTGLTGVSKLASEDVLNHDFERVFFQECSALRAPPVTLEFPGRRGQARPPQVRPARDHSLAEILSEGEQKVIAIADFLAEASLRTGSAPINFDDPVNSFDYRRVREIAKRIAASSAEHQVIVFTHRILVHVRDPRRVRAATLGLRVLPDPRRWGGQGDRFACSTPSP